HPAEVARLPVQPGNSDLCFQWNGPIADAITHLERCRVPIDAGPIERFGAKGAGTSVYFRDPDGSLLEFISYHRNDGDAPEDRARVPLSLADRAASQDVARARALVGMDGAARDPRDGKGHGMSPRDITPQDILVPISVGELMDKITILEIKSERLKNPSQL